MPGNLTFTRPTQVPAGLPPAELTPVQRWLAANKPKTTRLTSKTKGNQPSKDSVGSGAAVAVWLMFSSYDGLTG